MNTELPQNMPPANQPFTNDSMKLITHSIYALYAAGFFTGVTPVIGLIVAYVKRDDAKDTVYQGHYTWLIRTFWRGIILTGILGVFALILFMTIILAPIATAIMGLAAIWFVYRLIKGWLKLFEMKPIENADAWI